MLHVKITVPNFRQALLLSSAIWLLLGGSARADDECTPKGGSNVTCDAASYPLGITYTTDGDLTLTLNNPGMTVEGDVTVNATGQSDILTVHAIAFSEITDAISIRNNSGHTNVLVSGDGTMDALNFSGGGDVVLTMTGGLITNPLISVNIQVPSNIVANIDGSSNAVDIDGQILLNGQKVDLFVNNASLNSIYALAQSSTTKIFIQNSSLDSSRYIPILGSLDYDAIAIPDETLADVEIHNSIIYLKHENDEGISTFGGKINIVSTDLLSSAYANTAIRTISSDYFDGIKLDVDFTDSSLMMDSLEAYGRAFVLFADPNSEYNLNLESGEIVTLDLPAINLGPFVLGEKTSSPNVTLDIEIGSDMQISQKLGGIVLANYNDNADTEIDITSSGTVRGDLMLGGGRSSVTINDGLVFGNIYGDYDQINGRSTDTVNQGNDQLRWNGGDFVGQFFGQGGSDQVVVSTSDSGAFAHARFDGGVDQSNAERDVFIFENANLSDIDGTKITNFDFLFVSQSNVTFKATDRNAFTLTSNGKIVVQDGATFTADPGGLREARFVTNLENDGTFAVHAPDGLVWVTGSTTNSGTIEFTSGSAAGQLATPNYTGENGQLKLYVDFSRFGQNDYLVISGNVEGRTTVHINALNRSDTPHAYNLVGTNRTWNPGATVDANAFQLETGVVYNSGFAYRLFYSEDDYNLGQANFLPGFMLAPTTSENLHAFLDEDFVGRASMAELLDAGLSLQPYVPLYEAYPSVLLELTQLPSLRKRSGGRYDNGTAVTAGPALDALWGRVSGGFDHVDPQSSTTGYDYDLASFAMQAGIDGLFLDNEFGALVGGLTAHYQTGEATINSRFGESKIHPDGYGLGGTLTWFAANGFYTDAQAALTWYSSELKAVGIGPSPDDSNAFGYALSLEAGQNFDAGNGFSLTPQAQLSFANVGIDSFTGPFSDYVSFSDGQSLLGRVGLALQKQSNRQNVNGQARQSQIYGIANLYYEFLGETTARLMDRYDLAADLDAFTGEVGFGGSIDWDSDKVNYSAFAEVTVSTGFSTGTYGYGGNVGLKIRF
ncbi:autotransporter outer membrane beta-barrel domain-containing protein [Martelella sp. FLE1502]